MKGTILKQILRISAVTLALASAALAQTATPSIPTTTSPKAPATTPATTPANTPATTPAITPQSASKPAAKQAPLRLQSLAPESLADPFPPVNPKLFTAASPTGAEAEAYLHAVLGYDIDRIWRVEAIQTTAAQGVSKVTALVSERKPNAKVSRAIFYVLPDGKHLLAEGAGVLPFAADPYADMRKLLAARANGPSMGAVAKELEFVEFTDLQCPHCKEAEPTMKRLAADYPNAHIVIQNYPIADLHPFAVRAAAYGLCVAKSNDKAYFVFASAVYETQAALTDATGVQTLKDAATKAGADPVAIATCAATPETKAAVDASIQLAKDAGVDQTPTLYVNGRALPVGGVPYETLKQVIDFQAQLDGVHVRREMPSLR